MMDVIQKRTLMAVSVAFFLHLVVIFWVQNQENIIEVPISAEVISTQIGIAEAPQAKAPPVPKAKPIKKVVQKIRTPPIPKKVLTTQAPQEVSVPKAKPLVAPAPAVLQTATATVPVREKGGADQKVIQTDIRKYINKVARKIDRKKHYPRLSKVNQEQGTVRVKMTLGRAGQLLQYRVVQQPPFERLSQATVASIQAAAPFPPLPDSYPNSKITIEVPVRFRLSRSL